MPTKHEPSLTGTARELYGLPLEEFTESRNARAKQLKDSGCADLASQVRCLEKPTLSAWLVNQVVRHLGEEVEQVLALGAQLREAQEDLAGEELRDLDRQRRRLLTALTAQARGLGRELGRKVSDQVATEVEDTLRAAMTDEAGAEALSTGLLVNTFTAAGFGEIDLDGVLAVPGAKPDLPRSRTRPASRSRRATSDRRADEAKVRAARQVVGDAEEHLAAATEGRQQAQQQTTETSQAAEAAEEKLRALREQVRRAEGDLRVAKREAQRAAKGQERAEQREEAADRGVKRARETLERLT